jgi:CDP-diacylglycerol--glycerol-3-phosphate 3-phosphatidyltransferase
VQLIIKQIRNLMSYIAGLLNKWSDGKIKPSHITALSLLGHLPVAWALVVNKPILGAILLAFFSLMDALDGALARLQNSASIRGMYFDAVSDRVKEVIVFSALAYYAYENISNNLSWLIVAVCGTSLLVSYVKAKGEMAVRSNHSDTQKLNRLFGGGIASYEIRTFILIVGLIFGILEYVLILLLIANLITIVTRFFAVSKYLINIENHPDKANDKN